MGNASGCEPFSACWTRDKTSAKAFRYSAWDLALTFGLARGRCFRLLTMGRNRAGRSGDRVNHIAKASGLDTPGWRVSASLRYRSRSKPRSEERRVGKEC